MNLKHILYFIITIFVVVIISCRKELTSENRNELDPFIQDAKNAYYDAVQKVSGTMRMGSAEQKASKLTPIWSRAKALKTKLYDFTEVPVIANYKELLVYNFDNKRLEETDRKAIVSASFQRLLIFKRKGAFEQVIITYIPDIDYLKANKFDASANSIYTLRPDFSGYIEYRGLNGKKMFLLRIMNGKTTHKYTFKNRSDVSVNSSNASSGVKLMTMNCTEICSPRYVEVCGPVGDPPEEYCAEPEFDSWQCEEICIDIPDNEEDPEDPSQNDPCLDPNNFYMYGCEGNPGPGSGPTQPDPCAKARSLENDMNFKTQMNLLKTKLNENFEAGYYKTVGEVPVYAQGDPNTLSWPTPPLSSGAPLEYFSHSHYSANGSLSIFSPLDIDAFVQLLNSPFIADQNNFTMSVTTSQGTTYALALENLSKFNAFYNTYGSDAAGRQLLETILNIYIKDIYSANQNEENFLNFMKDSGIALLKASSNISSWKKLSYNSQTGSIVTNNCN